jgi:hypothetical protein
MFLDFHLNFNSLTTIYNFNCITYVNHMGSQTLRTLYVHSLGLYFGLMMTVVTAETCSHVIN